MLTVLNSKMFNLVLILSVVSFDCISSVEISSYARVSKNGGAHIDKSSTNFVSSYKPTLIDRQNNETITQQQQQKQDQERITSGHENVEKEEEKLEGRAIKSNYYFPLPEFLTKAQAMQSNSYKGDKEGRLIVYPSYTQNIDQTRRRYDMTPATGQVAQRRFAPGEAYGVTGYKLKHPEKFGGYKYPNPNAKKPAPPAPVIMMSNPAPKLPPPSPNPPSQSPPQPPIPMMMTDSPAQQYLPPSKFHYPIVVADTTADSSNIETVTASISHFLPTMPSDETSSMNPIIDLLSFDKVNTSYMPPELQAIKDSIDNNKHVEEDYSKNDVEVDTVPPADLHRFPPNLNSIYQPAVMMRNNKESQDTATVSSVDLHDLHKFPPNQDSPYVQDSYLSPPSGDKFNSIIDDDTNATDLHKFPPNINSTYLPPEMAKFMNLYNSYLPPASGQQTDSVDVNESSSSATHEETSADTTVASMDLHKFPPNVDSAYLPPEMVKYMNLYNSYLPPASGQQKDTGSSIPSSQSEKETSIPPVELHKFPPNLDSAYLPPEMMKYLNLYNSYLPPASGQQPETNSIDQQSSSETEDMMYVPPKDLHNFPPNINSNYLPPSSDEKDVPLINSYLPPASGDPSQIITDSQMSDELDLNPPPLPSPYSMMNQQAVNGGMQMMKQGYTYSAPMQPPQMMDMMATPAPPMMDMIPSGPMMMDDHSHHHHHPWDSYPDIYYDDHHSHHHHDEEPTTTTTTTEAPAEPRVKKYSYYYLGRKLWYIPLYFTFWFCLYVAALIIRSIGRHKVDLPNHYVQRSLHDMSHQELVEKINKMTEFTMAQIEDFKNKYL